jgi:hypothetical protein
MANLPDIFVARKIYSSEYQRYAPQGHFLWALVGKFFVRLDLEQICRFLDRAPVLVVRLFRKAD